MPFESRQGSSDNILAGEDFYSGNFMLTENPTKKVVKMIRKVKKNTINQLNLEEETTISGGFGYAILEHQTVVEPRLSPQREKEDAQINTRKRKASNSPGQGDRTIPETEVPKFLESTGMEEVHIPIVLVESSKDDEEVVEIPRVFSFKNFPIFKFPLQMDSFIDELETFDVVLVIDMPLTEGGQGNTIREEYQCCLKAEKKVAQLREQLQAFEKTKEPDEVVLK
ncbi:hypothetical protein ACH5RR_034179 [Cinchona calisaya]|uniref:Uncharacterized protein n=1 Tax=Cinchona calisaya TaxID=153742 RepID=A0ABD2YBH8_9GENT